MSPKLRFVSYSFCQVIKDLEFHVIRKIILVNCFFFVDKKVLFFNGQNDAFSI